MKKSVCTLVKIIVGSALVFTLSSAQANSGHCSQCKTQADMHLRKGNLGCNTTHSNNPSEALKCRNSVAQVTTRELNECQKGCPRQ